MSEKPPGPSPDLLTLPRQEVHARRRTAPRAENTSDVTRFAGLGWAALLGALAFTLGLWWSTDRDHERMPGPVSLPHREAGLTCASCHGDDADAPVIDRCADCHPDHGSSRQAHAALRAAGRMRCTTCHAPHRDLQGVAFTDDAVIRFGTFGETVVGPADGRVRGTVAVVAAGVCARCHDIDDGRDPIARCLMQSHRGLGGSRPSLCFDEHRALTADDYGALGSARERLAIWEAARQVVEDHPEPPVEAPAAGGGSTWGALAGGGLLAVLVLGVARWRLGPVGAVTTRALGRPTAPAVVVPPPRKRLPVIDAATCIGCSACIDACPYDVFELQSYVARVVRPDDCCGLTLCEQKCPNGSLRVTDTEDVPDRPAIDQDLQAIDVPGLFVAGDLTGLPLIRNAINQGSQAVQGAARHLAATPPAAGVDLDVLIVGAGPSGLSAALEATARGLRYAVLEQGSVAESIRSFPRGKLVFDQPLGVPLVGPLWLAEATKEELLAKWLRIVRQHRLRIESGRRVTGIDRDGDGAFTVHASGVEGQWAMRARTVVVAIGKRGTPRKLEVPVPEAWLDRVHYALADARSLAGMSVLVVGLGDVAMETAIALCRQPGTEVTVLHRGDDFRRGKRRNIAEMRRLVAAGRVKMRWNAHVQGFAPSGVVVSSNDGGPETCAVDAVFVMIGSIVPWAFLERAGVSRLGGGEPAVPTTTL